MRLAAVSSCEITYIMTITSKPRGIRCVRTGIVPITQASVSRSVAPPRPGVGASSRPRKATHAGTGHRSARRVP